MGIKIRTRVSAPKLSQVLIALCAFAIPIGSGINLITGLPFSKLFLAAFLLLLLYALFFMKFKRYMNPIFLQVYVAFMILHTLVFYLIFQPHYLTVTYYGETFYISLVRFFIYLLFFLVISQFLVDRKTTEIFTIFYSIGYGFTFILGLFVPSSELDLGRINGGFENPNSFGASSVMLIFLNVYTWSRTSSTGKGRTINFAFILLGLAGLILSQSRGAMAGLMGGIFIFVLWMPGLVKKFRIITMVVIGAGLVIILIPSQTIHHFLERANISARIETHSESRIVIWSDYVKEIPEYWLFGAGRNRSNEVIAPYNLPDNWQAPHCRYLFSLVEFGIVGLLSFVLGLIQLYARTYQTSLDEIKARLVRSFIIAWLIMMLVGDYKNSRDFWLFLAIAASQTYVSGNSTGSRKLQHGGT